MIVLLLFFFVGRSEAQATPPISMFKPVTVAQYLASQPVTVSGMVTGDFNGDGKSDIAVLVSSQSGNSRQLLIYLGNGDGTFQAAATIAEFNSVVRSLSVADFNKDGRADLVIATVTEITVFLGVGDGTFRAGSKTPIDGISGPVFVTDFNHDDIPDLVVASLSGGARLTSLLAGRGDGTFRDRQTSPIYPLAVSDVNNDGIPDLIGSVLPSNGATPTNAVFLGVGDGTFRDGMTIKSVFSGTVVIADFNADGKPDLVVPGTGGNLLGFPYSPAQIFLGNGDGTFKDPTSFQGIGGPSFAADFNNDGKLDLFSGFGVITGNGDGTFNKPVLLYTPPFGCIKPIICAGGIGSAIAADFNGDKLPDLVYSFNNSYSGSPTQVLSFLNAGKGDGVFQAAVPAATAFGVAAQQSIVSLYGVDLAPVTAIASGPPYPTALGGIRVHIGSQLAQLFYVSPNQINYALPPLQPQDKNQFSNPTIDIEQIGIVIVPKGISAPMVPDAPGIFIVDSSGLAAATAVRIAPDGTQTPVSVVDCASGQCVPVAIDTNGDPVYLSIYATGINRVGPSNFSPLFDCGSIGTVVYVGPQGQVPGMQQINLRLNPTTSPALPNANQFSCILRKPPGDDPYLTDLTTNTVYIVVK